MSWLISELEHLRMEFVLLAREPFVSMSEACHQFGISPARGGATSGYIGLKRRVFRGFRIEAVVRIPVLCRLVATWWWRWFVCGRPIRFGVRAEAVREVFEKVFERYGLPHVIRSDNGSPFASIRGPQGLTRLSAWWRSLGIELDRIDPGHPEQNGGHERMWREKSPLNHQRHWRKR